MRYLKYFTKVIKYSICVFILTVFQNSGVLPLAMAAEISGITKPINDVKLSSEVGGKITKIYFNEGDQIMVNDLILDLSKKIEEQEVLRRKLIWEDKTEAESALIRSETIKSMLDSTRELFEATGSVSKEELQEKQLEYDLSVAEHQRLMITERREQIEYEMALESLKKMSLRSPIGGIIKEIFLEEGEICEPRQELAHVVNISKCLFVSNIEESLSYRLKRGQTVSLTFQINSKPVRKKGIIIYISPVVDSASGLMEIKVEFENKNFAIRPGIPGTMRIR